MASAAVAQAPQGIPEPDPSNPQEVESVYRRLRQGQQGLHSKVAELEAELAEHEYVVFPVLLLFFPAFFSGVSWRSFAAFPMGYSILAPCSLSPVRLCLGFSPAFLSSFLTLLLLPALLLFPSPQRLVVKTLDGLDGERRCWRLVSGVLVERTVAEVLPAVTDTRDGIQRVVDDLKEKQKELAEELRVFRAKYGVREGPAPGSVKPSDEATSAKDGKEGVLVG
jgi:Prefoldin subunit